MRQRPPPANDRPSQARNDVSDHAPAARAFLPISSGPRRRRGRGQTRSHPPSRRRNNRQRSDFCPTPVLESFILRPVWETPPLPSPQPRLPRGRNHARTSPPFLSRCSARPRSTHKQQQRQHNTNAWACLKCNRLLGFWLLGRGRY